MPAPVMARPAIMKAGEVARELIRGPMIRGAASSRKALRRPRRSARPLPPRLPTAAKARRLLTTCKGSWVRASRLWHAVYSPGPHDYALYWNASPLHRHLGPEKVAHQALQSGVSPEPKIGGDGLQGAVDHSQVVPERESPHARHAHSQGHAARRTVGTPWAGHGRSTGMVTHGTGCGAGDSATHVPLPLSDTARRCPTSTHFDEIRAVDIQRDLRKRVMYRLYVL